MVKFALGIIDVVGLENWQAFLVYIWLNDRNKNMFSICRYFSTYSEGREGGSNWKKPW